MTLVDAVVAIILSLFVAGGPVVALINARAAKKPEMTTNDAEIQTTSAAAKELGIEERWKKYADEVEVRLSNRIALLDKKLMDKTKAHDSMIQYAQVLRGHIIKQLPPPPPPWPDDIT